MQPIRRWDSIGALSLALAMAFLPAAHAVAQGQVTAIAGVVTDASGAAIPGALVTIVTAGATQDAIDTYTSDAGTFKVDPLSPGTYQLQIALEGFETAVRQIVADAGQTASVNVTLELQRISQGVVVTARRVEEVA